MRNTNKAASEEFEEIRMDERFEDVEDALIKEHLQQIKVFSKDKEYDITKELIKIFQEERHEGEKVYEYEERVRKQADKVLDV